MKSHLYFLQMLLQSSVTTNISHNMVLQLVHTKINTKLCYLMDIRWLYKLDTSKKLQVSQLRN
jgi:hypothetical protein